MSREITRFSSRGCQKWYCLDIWWTIERRLWFINSFDLFLWSYFMDTTFFQKKINTLRIQKGPNQVIKTYYAYNYRRGLILRIYPSIKKKMFIWGSGSELLIVNMLKVAQLQSSKVVSGNPPACNCRKGVTDMRSGQTETKKTNK